MKQSQLCVHLYNDAARCTMRVIALFSALLVYHAGARQIDFCYAEDDDPYLNFASRTSYYSVHGGKTLFQIVPDCQPVQIWMLNRHGARYPSARMIAGMQGLPKLREKITNNHENRKKGNLCDKDLDNLKLWNPNPNLSAEWAQRATPEGAEEIILLARRLQSNFPDLLLSNNANITSQNYKFRSTNSERALSSMEAFMEGLFRTKNAVSPIEAPRGTDMLLRPHSNCSAWDRGLDGDPPYDKEYKHFLNGPDMMNAVKNISQRLGFEYTLSNDVIRLMYEMCRYDKTWAVGKISAWCGLFAKKELRIFEYLEDLKYYYGASYGRKVNSLLGCEPLQDMLNHFRELENGDLEGKPKGIFYFSHSSSLLNLLTAMEFGKDNEHLLASNYKRMQMRQFKTLELAPFSGNLVIVFYRCKCGESPNKVMIYLQEKPLMYEGCQVGLCDWKFLKTKLGNFVSQCDANFCSAGSGVAAYQAWNLMIVSMPALLLALWS